VTEKEPIEPIELRHPIQCILWERPEHLKGRSYADCFEEIACYVNSKHLVYRLYKCRECGQLYFYQWYEWVDWDDDDDRHYTTFIPVQTQAEIEALKRESPLSLLRCLEGVARRLRRSRPRQARVQRAAGAAHLNAVRAGQLRCRCF
jgi:hypothetical protein